MFEHYHQPLLPRPRFALRMIRCTLLALGLLISTLALGTCGLHGLERQTWLDAFLNSTLIMTGLGILGTVTTVGGKFFTAFFALLSALVFFSILAILFAPLLHRLLHNLHLDLEGKEKQGRN